MAHNIYLFPFPHEPEATQVEVHATENCMTLQLIFVVFAGCCCHRTQSYTMDGLWEATGNRCVPNVVPRVARYLISVGKGNILGAI